MERNDVARCHVPLETRQRRVNTLVALELIGDPGGSVATQVCRIKCAGRSAWRRAPRGGGRTFFSEFFLAFDPRLSMIHFAVQSLQKVSNK
jgi:hypothetical protein